MSVAQCWKCPQSPPAPSHWLELWWPRHSPHYVGSSAGSWGMWNTHWWHCWSKAGCLGRDKEHHAMQKKQFVNKTKTKTQHALNTLIRFPDVCVGNCKPVDASALNFFHDLRVIQAFLYFHKCWKSQTRSDQQKSTLISCGTTAPIPIPKTMHTQSCTSTMAEISGVDPSSGPCQHPPPPMQQWNIHMLQFLHKRCDINFWENLWKALATA